MQEQPSRTISHVLLGQSLVNARIDDSDSEFMSTEIFIRSGSCQHSRSNADMVVIVIAIVMVKGGSFGRQVSDLILIPLLLTCFESESESKSRRGVVTSDDDHDLFPPA